MCMRNSNTYATGRTAIRDVTVDAMDENGSPNPDDELTRSPQEIATIQQQIAETEETEEELSRALRMHGRNSRQLWAIRHCAMPRLHPCVTPSSHISKP